MPVKRTACTRDCPDACSILVTVDDDGRAIKLKGDPDDPVTKGFLCERTSRFLYRQYASDRLTRPLLDGQPVSWERSLDVAAENLLKIRSESGPAAILHYRSGGSLGLLRNLSDYLFESFGPVSVKRGDICSGAGEAAQELDFGLCDSHDLTDLEHSRTIVIWGKNVHTSGPHLLPLLLRARERGCRLVGIDVLRTRLAELCPEFVQVRPGGDFALAMALARVLFETGRADPEAAGYCDHFQAYRELVFSRTDWTAEAGVSPEQVESLARAYTDGPSALLVGWGLTRRANGMASVRALDALAAISGNLGVAGGGISYYFRRRASFDIGFIPGRSARGLSEARLGHEILAAQDPPIRMIWVTAGNPVSMLPDSQVTREAFHKSEFNVVVDTHPTDTTDCARLVLPTLTLLEDEDLVGAYGNHWVRSSSPTLAPPGEARHELWIWQQLASRLGLSDLLEGSVRDWKRRILRPPLTLEALDQGPQPRPDAPRVLFEGRRFPTASGKVNLIHQMPGPTPRPDQEFPLQLLAVSTPRSQSSQWSVDHDGPPLVSLHPSCGLQDGLKARLESRRGWLDVRVRLDESIHPEVAFMPKGGMLRRGNCANQLIAARESDGGGGAAFYDEPVRVVAR
ncbi:molybdopterin-containing oxidoreductase catalytic subunit [bacterium CPR1]|nr:molybdopterin-containing oxidoreductase catalytic subunit [bacterium CPR1]